MNKLFSFGAIVVLIVFGVGCYWYMNPQEAPSFLRGALPKVELRGPTVGFR